MLLSIIVPTFNRACFLGDLLSSIVSQHYRPIEFILVDDGSTDNTPHVFDEFVSCINDSNIAWRYFRSSNAGAPSARNLGIQKSNGNCIMFVDSDDVLTNDGIMKLMNSLKALSNLDYIFGQVSLVDVEFNSIATKPVGSAFVKNASCLCGYNWHTMAAIYKRDCIDRVGLWDLRLHGSQDWDFQARVKAYGGNGSFCTVIVGLWRQHQFDRIGVGSFNDKYVLSVLKVCENII